MSCDATPIGMPTRSTARNLSPKSSRNRPLPHRELTTVRATANGIQSINTASTVVDIGHVSGFSPDLPLKATAMA